MHTSISPTIALLDWFVIAAYLVFLIVFALWLSRRQENREDYYVGGRSIGAWPVGISVMATQCSTNSILGAPAFVAFAAGGGLVWLQYELAVPLAMIFLMLFMMPVYRQMRLISVYAYLERRFNRNTRLLLSGLFLFVRAFATAVTVYSIAIVIDLITSIGFFGSVLLLGVFTVVYDVLGGIRGVIYSDVIQLAILVLVLLILVVMLLHEGGGLLTLLNDFDPARRAAIDWQHHGIGDGQTFAFWPMLIGGFFLYVSYYGCDQSQVQRVLSSRDIDTSNRALLINGFLRFPLVALYCLIGVGIAVYAQTTPAFFDLLPMTENGPEVNLAVPIYMIHNLPAGLVGLGLVALFAAAMSSLDSVLNSLSATTMEDFIRPSRQHWPEKTELLVSRGLTALWGVITLTMAFFVDDIASTVLEAINKIGSLANGPILAVFSLGIFTRYCGSTGAISGLIAGIVFNGACWLFWPSLSWLWWNPFGFVVTVVIATVVSLRAGKSADSDLAHLSFADEATTILRDYASINWRRRSVWLVGWFVFLLIILVLL